ncbi:MAG TPA: hypothetical protein VEZ90_09765 [Blastocatellia bacterium]|nr:hypothetical protein [Blastocatellia bacterium]
MTVKAGQAVVLSSPVTSMVPSLAVNAVVTSLVRSCEPAVIPIRRMPVLRGSGHRSELGASDGEQKTK